MSIDGLLIVLFFLIAATIAIGAIVGNKIVTFGTSRRNPPDQKIAGRRVRQ